MVLERDYIVAPEGMPILSATKNIDRSCELLESARPECFSHSRKERRSRASLYQTCGSGQRMKAIALGTLKVQVLLYNHVYIWATNHIHIYVDISVCHKFVALKEAAWTEVSLRALVRMDACRLREGAAGDVSDTACAWCGKGTNFLVWYFLVWLVCWFGIFCFGSFVGLELFALARLLV